MNFGILTFRWHLTECHRHAAHRNPGFSTRVVQRMDPPPLIKCLQARQGGDRPGRSQPGTGSNVCRAYGTLSRWGGHPIIPTLKCGVMMLAVPMALWLSKCQSDEAEHIPESQARWSKGISLLTVSNAKAVKHITSQSHNPVIYRYLTTASTQCQCGAAHHTPESQPGDLVRTTTFQNRVPGARVTS